MFGYVTINRPELKLREYDRYHSYYCGLCRALKKRGGIPARLTLTYDMTFLGLLLTSLYEPETNVTQIKCVMHPMSKFQAIDGIYMDYAADMNILLSYYNLIDDWKDDHKISRLFAAKAIRGPLEKINSKYPRQAAAVESYIRELLEFESAPSGNIDSAAGMCGRMLAEIFVKDEDVWSATLRQMGFFLGKFIYLMDAYEDIADDAKKGSYNPWHDMAGTPEFRLRAEDILTMMMSECTLAFERLPIIQDAEILRNILYAGVFAKFNSLEEKAKHA